MGVDKERIIARGKGREITAGHIVTIHCTGYVRSSDLSLMQFWSTRDCRRVRTPIPYSFKVGQGHVIKAWDKGVLGMQVGEVAHLKCTADYAFGAKECPEFGIGPNTDLEFKIEVIAIDWECGEEDKRMK